MKRVFVDSADLDIMNVRDVTLMGVKYAILRFILKMGVVMSAKNMTQAAVSVM